MYNIALMEITPDNSYTLMQKTYYDNEGKTGNMNRENHQGHNANPDYWNILVKDAMDLKFIDKVGLDFGCGCGRNVINLIDKFRRMDGVDISEELVKTCRVNLDKMGIGEAEAKFYACDGVSLNIFEDSSYDFIMSTIVLQHICVYSIRYNYLKEFYRILKDGGSLSFQMGFGSGHPFTRNYYENYYGATSTNSGCDVRVDNPQQIIDDLTTIGFKNIVCEVSSAFDDLHHEWIFVKAEK
jgi:ubiquinone/menaquinone biosynthesis C-methylase UbiE